MNKNELVEVVNALEDNQEYGVVLFSDNDVQIRRIANGKPMLTDAQAKAVVELLDKGMDLGEGISWDDVDYYTEIVLNGELS